MKYIIPFILVLLFMSGRPSHAQNSSNKETPGPYHVEKDTMYAMVDHQGRILNLPGMPYLRKWWPENGKWHENLFFAEAKTVARTGWYSDKECTVKEGIFQSYHPNGMMKDSGTYIKNTHQGDYMSWYDNGEMQSSYHYNNNIPVDSCFDFTKEGTLASVMINDQQGNGIEQVYYPNGKVKMLGGIKKGQRQGKWIVKREDGTKMMALDYIEDSVAATNCFEADGVTVSKGDCIFEKVPEFPGGIKGWTQFLRKDLRYPNQAITKNIQGVVRIQFIVDKEGNLSEYKILSSPDKSLSDEVLRLMKRSPKWVAAIQLNKPVIYRHIQAITFRLE